MINSPHCCFSFSTGSDYIRERYLEEEIGRHLEEEINVSQSSTDKSVTDAPDAAKPNSDGDKAENGDKAESRADEAKSRADEAKSGADEAESGADEAESGADKAESGANEAASSDALKGKSNATSPSTTHFWVIGGVLSATALCLIILVAVVMARRLKKAKDQSGGNISDDFL